MAECLEQPTARIGDARARGAGLVVPFTLEDVKALVEALEGSDVTSLRWGRNGHQILIRRGEVPQSAPQAPIVTVVAPPAPPAVAAPAAAPPGAPKAAEAKNGTIVASPFVGTFYRAPSPESAPFVELGTAVKKGQVLCIVEAMKLMNEIEADGPGRIAEILVSNGTPVDLGQALFRIEPA
jgi:acetyl-CoA carboxylase biotin carboxyl carrier protein